LVPTLKNILNIKGAKLLHVVTRKGKGYPPAESEPVRFHGSGPFEPATGAALPSSAAGERTYTEAFSRKLLELAQNDPKIVAITAAMPEGTGLDKFRDAFPERFFDVGIAEAHAVCFAAGLAKAGLKGVVAIYSTFLQRAYDQIVEEVALQGLPVVFAVDRAGIVGEDGLTHQGIFDIAFLRSIPGLVLMAPKDGAELEGMLEWAFALGKPVAIRYPRSLCPLRQPGSLSPLELGRAELLKEGRDFLLIALGSMLFPAYEAAGLLEKQGLRGTVVNARFVKPLDEPLFNRLAAQSRFIFTVEEGIIDAGFGSAVAEAINRPLVRIGLPGEFIPHGKRESLLQQYGLSAQGIAEKIKGALG
jgi:1-deoxy-D-xylulose-5-phosphate synthase